jgi:hypothetical protein
MPETLILAVFTVSVIMFGTVVVVVLATASTSFIKETFVILASIEDILSKTILSGIFSVVVVVVTPSSISIVAVCAQAE